MPTNITYYAIVNEFSSRERPGGSWSGFGGPWRPRYAPQALARSAIHGRGHAPMPKLPRDREDFY